MSLYLYSDYAVHCIEFSVSRIGLMSVFMPHFLLLLDTSGFYLHSHWMTEQCSIELI